MSESVGSLVQQESWMGNICVVAAEASGDAHAAALVQAMRQVAGKPLSFWGVAGPRMRAAGVVDIARVEDLSVMGFGEVLSQYFKLRLIHRRVETEIARLKPSLVILVDAPAFNLPLASTAFEAGCIVHYHIPPKVWAHGEHRVEVLQNFCHLVTCVLPFEEDFLRERGVPAHYVGHPLKDQVDTFRRRHASFVSAPTVKSTARNIALLPGSRVAEIKAHLPVLVESFEKLRRILDGRAQVPASQQQAESRSDSSASKGQLGMLIGSIPIAETLDEVWFQRELSRLLELHKVPEGALRAVRGSMYSVLAKADYAWVCSGTAVLETCFFEVPHAVIYRTGALSYAIASRIVQVDYIGLGNLIAGRAVCPEFIQDQCTAENLVEHASALLQHPDQLNAVRQELHLLAESFPPKSAERAASLVVDAMGYWKDIPREARHRMHRRGLGPS